MNAESKLEQAAKAYAKRKDADRWVFTPEQRHKFCIEDFISGADWQSLTTPESNDKFEFASYLTGHDIDTCKQMYNDYLNLQSNKHKAI